MGLRMMRKLIKTFLLLIVSMLIGYTANSLAQEGNKEAGKEKSALCVPCHGQNGWSSQDNIPHLAGQTQDYLFNQLQNFRSGYRRNIAMKQIAKILSEQDMLDLAAYFSSIKTRFQD